MTAKRLTEWISILILPAMTALFVVLHSGERASDLCERELFVRSGELSLWPPGARCSYGEPMRESVVLHPQFAVALALVLVTAIVVWWNRPRR